MIIHFPMSAAELGACNKDKILASMSALLRAHRLGHNLLVVGREVWPWCQKNLELNPRERATLLRVSQEVTQTGGLISVAPTYMVVTAEKTQDISKAGSALRISMFNDEFENIVNEPILVVEDIENDLAVFRLIFDKTREALPFPRYKFDPHHGGGASIQRVVAQKVDDKRIVVVLIDSDCRSPSAARDPGHGLAILASEICTLYVLPCLEVENLIPLSALELVDSVRLQPAMTMLRRMHSVDEASRQSAQQHFYFWFDLKEGLDDEKLSRLKNPDVKHWVGEKVKALSLRPDRFKVEGLGPRVLKEFINCDRAVGEFGKCIEHPTWKENFQSFFMGMLWNFAAPQPQRA